tara:strand:+ start:57 stop:971 length:915 start_codon:yes stop_codon:yes gene_type:complete
MRPIYENTVIHIDVTNACWLKCTNCTRHVGHHRKSYFMDLDYVRKAIDSLHDFPGRIGLMGGDPTLHPKFDEICKIYSEMIPKRNRELWTSGFNWKKSKDIIFETFDEDRITYNDHSTMDGKHTPLLVSIDEVVEDKDLMWKLIDNCWIQEQWSASINPKGAFFCEVAASLDYLLDGPGGYPIERGWWKKTPEEFQDQVDRYCKHCSGALPMAAESDGQGGREKATIDTISPGMLEKLKKVGSPKINGRNYKLFNKKYTNEDLNKYTPEWSPSNFRPFVARDDKDYDKAGQTRIVDVTKSGKIK